MTDWPRRERMLVTREGAMVVQSDPHNVAVEHVDATVDGHARRFFYEATITEHDALGRTYLMAVYQEANGAGEEPDPLDGA